MITHALVLLGAAWATAAATQLALWLVSLRTRNAGIVDIGWAGSFALVVLVFAALGGAPLARTWPMIAMVMAWSLRLAGYLIVRGAASGAEEGRYAELRRRWSPGADRAFFVFFQAQALLTGVLSIGFVWTFSGPAPSSDLPLALGGAVWLVGLIGETTADAQLRAFKRDPARRGQVCDVGLWGWSRHPNYFFETCVWCGYAIASLAFAGGWLAWLAPAIVLASILKVTGIPATEAQAVRSKGDLYRNYQARVSAFVPWPPRAERT
jgi:steroid 5-alpha reductase family enzyme